MQLQRIFKGFRGKTVDEMNEIDLVVLAHVGEIFFEALDYETNDERHAFVEEACLGDAELRRKVYGLFEMVAASEGFFEDAAKQLMIPAKDLVEILDNRLEALRT